MPGLDGLGGVGHTGSTTLLAAHADIHASFYANLGFYRDGLFDPTNVCVVC